MSMAIVPEGWSGLVESTGIPVDTALGERLRAWNGEEESWSVSLVHDEHDGETGTGNIGIPHLERLAWAVEGRLLAADLQAVCGPEVLAICSFTTE